VQTRPAAAQIQGSPCPMTPRASIPRPDRLGFLTSRMPHGLFSKLGGDEDREVLRKAGICFRCRQPGHMSMECPEGNKGHDGKLIVKVESVEQPVVESDQEPSPYVPIPTIRIPVKIADANLGSSIARRGSGTISQQKMLWIMRTTTHSLSICSRRPFWYNPPRTFQGSRPSPQGWFCMHESVKGTTLYRVSNGYRCPDVFSDGL